MGSSFGFSTNYRLIQLGIRIAAGVATPSPVKPYINERRGDKWGGSSPTSGRACFGDAAKGSIELYRAEMFSVVFEPASLGEFFRVEIPLPVFVRPAGSTDSGQRSIFLIGAVYAEEFPLP